MNIVSLVGRITKDPELRKSSNDQSYIPFTLAVTSFANGEKYTQFLSCFAWNKTAENLARFVKKGDKLSVVGSLNSRQEKKENSVSSIMSVKVNQIEFLNSSKRTEDSFVNTAGGEDKFDFDLIDDKSDVADESILWED